VLVDTIYKKDSKGKVRFWQAEYVGNQWWTTSGLLDGKAVSTAPTICTPKSQPTAEAQAEFEARAERQKKLDRDYHASIDDIDRVKMFKPMLAEKYEGGVTFPVYTQPKLDGIRCIATAKGLFSRQNQLILGVPHIEAELAPLFAKDPDLILDGELYNHDLKADFEQIVSIVRKKKPSPDDLIKSEAVIQYHIYDCPSAPGNFQARFSHLREIGSTTNVAKSCFLVESYWIGNTEDLDRFYANFLEAGYEGQMVRLDAPYDNKRSKSLLKRKEFLDGEFPIIEIEEGLGNWAGYAKKVTCRLPDGRSFGAGIRGTQSFTKDLLANRDKQTQVTVRYFTPTGDGIPRFPVAVAFHEGERSL
jgi:DNA ligase-1